MAKTCQEYIRGVLDHAIARNYGGLANGANAASVKEGSPLAALRPKVSEVYTATGQPAFPWEDIGRLVAALREYTYVMSNQWPSRNKTCQVCAHPERAAIEQAFDSGVGRYRIGTRFGISAGAVLNHAQMRHTKGAPLPDKAIRPMAAYMIEFLILTAVRKSQAVMARWDEIDMKNAVWRCEQHKTRERKVNRYGETVLTGEAHVIPLSDAAMAVLHAMKERQKAEGVNSEYVFPSHDGHGHADHAINAWLKGGFRKRHPEFGNIEFTPHGMRTAFKSWAMSQGFPEVDSEIALAHAVGTHVSRIYAKDADTIERRRVMMQQWADHCGRTGPVPDVVVPFRKAK